MPSVRFKHYEALMRKHQQLMYFAPPISEMTKKSKKAIKWLKEVREVQQKIKEVRQKL